MTWLSINHFGWVQSLVGPSHFGQVLIIKIIPEKSNLNLTQTIWTIQNHFGPTEGTSHQVL